MLLINNTNCFPLKINLNEKINISNKNILDFLAYGYCRYINVRGKNKGKCCGRRLKKNRSYCFEHNYNINKKNKKTQSKIIKKIEIDVYTSTTQLICYHNDKKEIKKIDHIKIRDKFIDSNSIGIKEKPKIPLLICYNNYGKLFKRKKRLNKKQRLRKKLNKKEIDVGASKLDLDIEYNNVDIKNLNDTYLLSIIGDVTIPLKKWPLELQYYRDFLEYEIMYFHCFINKSKEDIPKVWIFYKVDGVFNNIKITYSKLHDILIKKYSRTSINNFIKYYYEEELSILR